MQQHKNSAKENMQQHKNSAKENMYAVKKIPVVQWYQWCSLTSRRDGAVVPPVMKFAQRVARVFSSSALCEPTQRSTAEGIWASCKG
jgi:hypothetical protein